MLGAYVCDVGILDKGCGLVGTPHEGHGSLSEVDGNEISSGADVGIILFEQTLAHLLLARQKQLVPE